MFKSKPIKYQKKAPSVQGIINRYTKGKSGGMSKPNSPKYKIPKTPRSSGFGWGP